MAGRTNRPYWETSDVDRKPTMSMPNQTKRVRNGGNSFLPSGAVEYRPDPDGTWRASGHSTMSGNGSSSRTGAVTSNGNGEDRYRDRSTTPFGARYGTPNRYPGAYGFDDLGYPPADPLSMLRTYAPNLAAGTGFDEVYNFGRTSGPSRRPGLLSPFAPAPHASTSTVAPTELAAGVRPLASPPPRVPEDDFTMCHCLVCSDSTPAKCLQSRLAQHCKSIGTAWEEERALLENLRLRMDRLYWEESTIILEHYRGLWEAEKTQLKSEIDYLNEQVQRLGDENLLLRGKVADQAQGGEPIIHHGSFQGSTSPVNGGPPSPVASRQTDGVRDSRQPTRVPGCYCHLFPLESTESPQVPTLRSPSLPRTSVSPPASAPPSLPSTRISMSPQPGQETIPISPVFSPYSSSLSPRLEAGSPSAGVSAPVRSPKRPISVIDVHEVDPKLEGISLRASAVRKTTFKEAPSDESPPSKRQRSLSQDYYIVSDLKGEDEETDVKKIEGDEDEERRLTMHAGYTPNHSPSLPRATASGPSQGSATPTASSILPENSNVLKAEDRSATASVTEEAGESSRVAYPDLSNQLIRVESSSSDSCSQGVLSAASGDAPLKGPLMIKNIPAQDELFLAALNERLEPISQGQDSLPRAVQTPVAMPASLPAVYGGPLGGADAKQTAAFDNTGVSGTQSEADEEHDGVHIKMEHIYTNPLPLGGEEQKENVHTKSAQPAVRIKWPNDPAFGYDGTPIKTEPGNPEFFYGADNEDLPVKSEASPVAPIKIEDSDDDSDARSSEPEVTIKFKSTSNFGAPFGRM